jgi:hypothetical protein
MPRNCAVVRRWRWLVALSALALGCLAPGASIAQPAPRPVPGTIATPAAPAPSGSECAAVSCDRGSPTAPAPAPGLALAGTLAAGTLVLLTICAVRRRRPATTSLPAGSPTRLLRPPQLALCA